MKNQNKTTSKREWLIMIAILLSCGMMYILDFWQESSIIIRNNTLTLVYDIIRAAIEIGLIMLIPFEGIYHWMAEKGKSARFMGIPADGKGNKILFILYFLCAFASMGITKIMEYLGYRFSFLLSVILLVIIIDSFDLIAENMSLVCFNLFMLLVNGLFIYYISGVFYVPILFSIALAITFCIRFISSERIQKIRSVSFYIAMNIIIFFSVVLGTGKTNQLNAWLNLESSTLGQDRFLLCNYSSDDLAYSFYLHHPFVTMYTKLGVIPVVLFIVAFFMLTFGVIYGRKLLSQKRYGIMTGIYMMFAVSLMTTLLADIGFLPPTSVPLISSAFFLQIGLMIRILKKR